MNATRREFIRQLFGLLALPQIGRASRLAPQRPPLRRFRLQRFRIAGFRYYRGPELVATLRPGDALTLQAEPDNISCSGRVPHCSPGRRADSAG